MSSEIINNILFVGTSKAAIPVPDDFFPYHSWGPRRLFGVHDDLNVRVIYIEKPDRLLLISLENGDIDPEWNIKLGEYINMPSERILISATHTHTAPYIGGYWPEDVEDVEKSERYTENAWKTLLEAVEKAMSSTEEAMITVGYGTCDVNINRDKQIIDPATGKVSYRMGNNIHGVTDRTVSVIQFIRPDGSPLAVLFNYGVHSSILFGAKMKDGGQTISGDLAGFAMSEVEKELNCVAMYTMAPSADLNPKYACNYESIDENGKHIRINFADQSYVVVQLLGRELADEVVAVCHSMDKILSVSSVNSISETIFVPGKVKKDGPGIPWPESPADYEPAEDVPLPLSVSSLGSLAIVSIGCETSSRNTEHIKEIIINAGYTDVVIITQCNGSSSYMSDKRGYEVVTFSAMASHMMPEAVDCMFAGIADLAARSN